MEVLDAIMLIISDLFNMNNIPNGTSGAIVNGIRGFIEGIVRFFEMMQNLFQGTF